MPHLLSRKRRLSRLIGLGFISTCSGLEITNIGVFTYIGSAYGFKLFWSILLSATILAFFQQLAYIVSVEVGGLSGFRRNKLLYNIMMFGLYLANIATMTANIVGVSVILSSMLGVNYVYVAVLVGVVVYAIVVGAKGLSEIQRILTVLTLALASYIYLAVVYMIQNPKVILDVIYGLFSFDSKLLSSAGLDIIAVFGAAAAPYALILELVPLEEVDYEEEFASIGLGLFFTSLAGISIGFLSAVTLYSSNVVATTPQDLLVVLGDLGPLAKPLFGIGVTASSLLAIIAIMIVNSYVIYEYRRKPSWPRGLEPAIHSPISRDVNLQTIIASLLGVGALLYFIGSNPNWFVESIKLLSIVISLAGWTPLLAIIYYYRRTRMRDRIVEYVAYVFFTLVMIVNILGLIHY